MEKLYQPKGGEWSPQYLNIACTTTLGTRTKPNHLLLRTYPLSTSSSATTRAMKLVSLPSSPTAMSGRGEGGGGRGGGGGGTGMISDGG